MTREELFELMGRFEAGSIHRLEYSEGESRLVLEKAPPAIAAAPAAPEGATIDAPLVGTFYAASSPDAAPFVKAGDTVRKNDTVCILEAMKMMSEVPAPCDCVIEEVLAANGDLVGYGQPLFRIREL